MSARLLLHERHQLTEDSFAELKVWSVPTAVRGSSHSYKYALAYVVGGVCVLRYDNEAGKGDHRHLGETESPYRFVSPAKLLADFWADVDQSLKQGSVSAKENWRAP
jgi:hypothetical protein